MRINYRLLCMVDLTLGVSQSSFWKQWQKVLQVVKNDRRQYPIRDKHHTQTLTNPARWQPSDLVILNQTNWKYCKILSKTYPKTKKTWHTLKLPPFHPTCLHLMCWNVSCSQWEPTCSHLNQVLVLNSAKEHRIPRSNIRQSQKQHCLHCPCTVCQHGIAHFISQLIFAFLSAHTKGKAAYGY